MTQVPKKVIYVTATLPALTVTFIYREVFRLRQMGIEVECVSMNTPGPDEVSEEAKSLLSETTYLDSVSLSAKIFAHVLTSIRHTIKMSRCLGTIFLARPTQGVRDYVRLLYHWIEAAYLYNHLDLKGTHHIHAHFVNGPTSIAMFLSEISGVPFSFTMHASMIWLDPIALYNKLRKCLFCASISEYNSRYIAEEYGTIFAPKIHIVHCGIDPEGFALPLSKISTDRPVRLLGVGQLNPRKGFHVLIEACRMLRDKGTAYVCKIVGDGDQRTELEAMVDEYNLRDLVSFAGAVKHEVIVELLEESDIFVLPCVIAKDGWRDGIPVALMEAMFNRRVVVSTRILGIPELIDDRINGRLVDPEDPMGLAIAIEELAGSPDTCSDLALKGREKVLEEFNNSKSALQLARLFDAAS